MGITALANLTAQSVQNGRPRTFFSLEEVKGGYDSHVACVLPSLLAYSKVFVCK